MDLSAFTSGEVSSPRTSQQGDKHWQEIEAQATLLDQSELWISGLSLTGAEGIEVEYEVPRSIAVTVSAPYGTPPALLSTSSRKPFPQEGSVSSGAVAGPHADIGALEAAPRGRRSDSQILPPARTTSCESTPSEVAAHFPAASAHHSPRNGLVVTNRHMGGVAPNSAGSIASNSSNGSAADVMAGWKSLERAAPEAAFRPAALNAKVNAVLPGPGSVRGTESMPWTRLSLDSASSAKSPISARDNGGVGHGNAGKYHAGFRSSRPSCLDTEKSIDDLVRQMTFQPFTSSSQRSSAVGSVQSPSQKTPGAAGAVAWSAAVPLLAATGAGPVSWVSGEKSPSLTSEEDNAAFFVNERVLSFRRSATCTPGSKPSDEVAPPPSRHPTAPASRPGSADPNGSMWVRLGGQAPSVVRWAKAPLESSAREGAPSKLSENMLALRHGSNADVPPGTSANQGGGRPMQEGNGRGTMRRTSTPESETDNGRSACSGSQRSWPRNSEMSGMEALASQVSGVVVDGASGSGDKPEGSAQPVPAYKPMCPWTLLPDARRLACQE